MLDLAQLTADYDRDVYVAVEGLLSREEVEGLKAEAAIARGERGRCGKWMASSSPISSSSLRPSAGLREMWTRCFRRFLSAAGPGDVIVFAPELLAHHLTYEGRTTPSTTRA